MSIVGIDLGTCRIGVAISDSEGRLVRPLATIERRSLSADIRGLRELLASREVDRVVVGLPLNMDGTEGRMATLARNFGRQFEEETGLPVELQDERLSSFEARERIAPLRTGHARKRRPIDALAAAIILETWFEKIKDIAYRG